MPVDLAGTLEGLKRRLAQAEQEADPVGTVGYSANYSLAVHENLEAVHRVGQAKFLETPLRQMREELGRQITEDLKRGMPLRQAIARALLRLQRESMKLVPVDTGYLKNSAFTSVE